MALRVGLRLEKRRGREVTLVTGLAPLGDAKIAALAGELKRLCACGGAVEPGGTVLVQGDQRAKVEAALAAREWTVVRVGG